MCSWLACAPAPGQPSPSSVGTPSAAVKFPSDPPPRCCFGNAIPTCSAIPRACVVQRRIAGVLGEGRPVHAALHRHPAPGGLRAAGQQIAAPSRTPSATEFTRRSISQPASGEITFGRDATPDRRGVQRDAAVDIHHLVQRAGSGATVPRSPRRRPGTRRRHARRRPRRAS